eukprot:1160428-Pelagomonas_calceolata.AAC.5
MQCSRISSRKLQHAVPKTATCCALGCNMLCSRLQHAVLKAATRSAQGYNMQCSRLSAAWILGIMYGKNRARGCPPGVLAIGAQICCSCA